LYWIGLKIPPDAARRLETFLQSLRALDPASKHRWLLPQELHVTLALPGRPGKPYREDDIPSMIEALRKIAGNVSPLTLQLGNINCFPSALFREVYSEDERLFALHEQIAESIPFSEEPQYCHEHYTPHMSLCYLRETDTSLLRRDAFDRHVASETVTIESLHFCVVSDIADMTNTPLAEIALGSGILLQAK
jgi:2'-5' RNA ligase